ncbi:VanZ family protein [Shimia biformata]|uniref:VanZ family protein n=1 Tax=Shimia biformata TaxID=1294299 RepID=UPI00194EC532|nr:VanZ family protein [Shimia biformata]
MPAPSIRPHWPSLIALAMTLTIAAMICWATLTPVRAPSGLPGNDKAYHFIAFAMLSLPCAILSPRWLVALIPLALVFGAMIEVIQPMVGRERELADFSADSLGAACGAALGIFLIRKPVLFFLRARRAKLHTD